MTQDEALKILARAADNWANELGEWIIPADADDDAEGHYAAYSEICNALNWYEEYKEARSAP